MLTSLPLPYHNKRSPAHSGDELPFLGDELQNRGARGASAPTQGGSSPQSLPCKGRWMRRKAQTEGCIAGLRQKYPARPGRALSCPRRGRCLHRPGNPAVAQGPRGGRNRPPYIAAINRCQPANASHPPGPPAGRCKHRPLRRRHPQGVRRPAVPSPAARMPCIAGRAFTPAGEVWGGVTPLFCVSAAPQGRGGVRQPGRVLAKAGSRHPQGPAAEKPSAVTPAGSKFRW